MKKILTLLGACLLTSATIHAQMFWVENFESGSTGGTGPTTVVSAYVSPNGPWTLTVTGTEGTWYNQWYVSCAENGHTTGGCGTGCVALSTTATLASLHVGSRTLGDNGASYDAGGLVNTTTDRRANSPTINCTGRYGINMAFYYTEDGDLTSDDGSVWYSPDNGTTWSLLVNTPKTPPICPGGQGYWDHYVVALPTSANNNPNVKIGFRWVNNNDGVGTDPSFAVDSVSLTATSTTSVPTPSFSVTPGYTVCEDSCITFTNTSTGTIDSFTWSMPGVTISTPHASPVTVCYSTAATYTMTLNVYSGGTAYPATHGVTVNAAPAAITGSHNVCIGYTDPLTSATIGGTWSSSTPSVATVGSSTGIVTGIAAGTTTITYTIGTGCITVYSITVTPLPCTTGIEAVNNNGNTYWIAQPSGNMININSSSVVSESITIAVFDPTGRQITAEPWVQGSSQKQLDCSQCAPGIYIIRLSGKNTSEVLKWLKE